MKIKGVIKNLKIKNDNSKNISRNFSGAVEGSVGSVQFQKVPCSSLNFFSRSIGPFQCSVNANYRVNANYLSLPERLPLLCIYWLPLFSSLLSV